MGKEELFYPLRTLDDIVLNVPQTFPIVIRKGNRDRIYEIMNAHGFGVVSLYHTMIEELRTEKHSEANYLSHCIMNLPAHQDCNPNEYSAMIQDLVCGCNDTQMSANI